MNNFTLYKTDDTKIEKVGFWNKRDVLYVRYRFNNLNLFDCEMTHDTFKSICSRFGFQPERTDYVFMSSFGAVYDVPYEHPAIWVSEDEVSIIPELCKALSEEEERLIQRKAQRVIEYEKHEAEIKIMAEQKGFKEVYCGGKS